VDAIVIKELMCDRPKAVKGIVVYPEIDMGALESVILETGSIKAHRYALAKLPLIPKFNKENKLAIFPSSQPHNAFVWVGGLSVAGTYSIAALALRTIAANIYRNHYPINRVPFWTIDNMNKFFCFGKSIVLARMSTPKIVKDELFFVYGMEDESVERESLVLDPITSMKVDVSEYEKEVDESIFTSGQLMDLLASLRGDFKDDNAFRKYLFFQRSRQDNGGNVSHYLARLLMQHSWIDLYKNFYRLGEFDDDYKEYLGVSDEDEKAPGLELPYNNDNTEEEDEEEIAPAAVVDESTGLENLTYSVKS